MSRNNEQGWWGRRRPISKIGIIVGGIIVGLFVLGTISSLVRGPSDEDVARAVEQTRIAETQVEQRPASTSTPAPVASRCSSQAEEQYLEKAGDFGRKMGTQMRNIGTYSTEAAQNPVLLVNDPWRTKMLVALAALDFYATELDQMQSPKSLRPIEQDLDKVAASTHQFVTLYSRGLDTLDEQSVMAAIDAMDDVNRHLSGATASVRRLCG